METKDYLTLAVSVSAFVVSLVTLLLKGPENRRIIRNQLTDIIGKLNAVQAEARKLSMEKEQERFNPHVNALFAFFNDQRVFLVWQASFLIRQIPKDVSDIEYALIARAFDAIGDQSQADRYWNKCIQSSQGEYYRSMNLRGYASYLFAQGSFEDGRKKFEESVSSLTGDSDRMRHAKGETYLRWALIEREFGFGPEADTLLAKAKATFESLGHKVLKHHGLSILERAENASPAGPKEDRGSAGA
jgi:tetratricopeptide (TPR) repeat protein